MTAASCNNANIPRRSIGPSSNNSMGSGSCAEENEKLERSGKDQVNIETLKAGDETIAKQL